MIEKKFELRSDQAYIPLNKLLQVLGYAQTGGHAKLIIQNEEVLVNNLIETRVRNKLVQGDVVNIQGTLIEII
ncbi:RNA-binding S4 domain-containing protein [Aureibaculum marinum]|uniref:RNA-binding S4 domain-containing protein n=1 Tax=Aureibaculum marinum TaxID=2487930 RepID=A0A3N4NTE4_9FLAO|nr:RNA-binding S4 domain-containing protein [Aureibaculum marinum]RPD97947.1 RNA-binding S4 domain-containing protein [Aureibaculum marinum]